MITSKLIQQIKKDAPSVFTLIASRKTNQLQDKLASLRHQYKQANEIERVDIQKQAEIIKEELALYASGDPARALTPSETETL